MKCLSRLSKRANRKPNLYPQMISASSERPCSRTHLTLSSRKFQIYCTCSRLESLDHHDALFLLKNVFYIPKFLYLLRTSAGYLSAVLKEFGKCLRTALENIMNCHLIDQALRQATIHVPVKFGGLGVRQIEDISLPAFIASCYQTPDTISALAPSAK